MSLNIYDVTQTIKDVFCHLNKTYVHRLQFIYIFEFGTVE